MTTINIGTANTYIVQKTVGGYIVCWLRADGDIVNADGGKLYAHRQNAHARAKSLNHQLEKKLKKYGYVEAYFDGYTAGVSCDDYEPGYDIFIQSGGMPPHFRKHVDTIEQVKDEMNTHSFFPLPIAWKAVKREEI